MAVKPVYRFNRCALDPEFYRTEWARLRALQRKQRYGEHDAEYQRLYRDYRVYRESRNAEYWRQVRRLVERCHADYGPLGCSRVAGVGVGTAERWLRPGARPTGRAISRMIIGDRAKGGDYRRNLDEVVAEADEFERRFGQPEEAA